MGYEWSFGFLLRYTHLFWVGIGYTLAYTVGTVVLGLLIGLVLGLARLSRSRVANVPLIAFIEVFRCTPLLVQIVWFYYALPVILGVQIPALLAAALVLSFYTAAFYAEIFRGGVLSIEAGQWDAARALGLRPWSVMRLVVLPQVFRTMLPVMLTQTVILFQDTSLVYAIGAYDMLKGFETAGKNLGRPVEAYLLAAVLYFLMCIALSWIVRRIQLKVQIIR